MKRTAILCFAAAIALVACGGESTVTDASSDARDAQVGFDARDANDDVIATNDTPGTDGADDATNPADVPSDTPACLGATEPCTGGGCCAGLSCGTTTLGQVCCGNEGATCATENGEDCCGDLWCIAGHCSAAPTCLQAVQPCNGSGCCAGLTCGNTTAGHVCCGNEGASCHTANGEDCCGSLECVSGHCVQPTTCRTATQACTGSECCSGLSCGTTTLGRVCCGNAGSPCHTSNGEDCCGSLECINGHCGSNTGGSCTPHLTYYPVRARHNHGYDSTAGDSSLWSCNDDHSNSDFVGGGRHLGNDIWAVRGAPVVATVSGTLRYIAYSSYSGNQVTIVDSCGYYHFFCHLDHFGAGIGPSANGQHVDAGRVIGYVGNTGTASNGVVHLHYSIYPNDNYDAGVDPWPYCHAVESNVCSLP